jgi:uncharacterized membrane protein YuzA (DUF378 family)
MKNSDSNKKTFNNIYLKTKINMVIFAIVIVGALNLGATAIGYNIVELLSKNFNSYLKVNYPIDKIFYIIVAICALWLASKKTSWLPFLGHSVMPASVIPLSKPQGANKKVSIKTKPDTKVVYWASKNENVNVNVIKAYGDYSNAGVVNADANGNAILEIVESAGYVVIPSGKKVPRHIHYRTLCLSSGIMGKVETVTY